MGSLFFSVCDINHATSTKSVFCPNVLREAQLLFLGISYMNLRSVSFFGIWLLAGTCKLGLGRGTPGYSDPDYVRTGVVSEATEVYSFGIVRRSSPSSERPTCMFFS